MSGMHWRSALKSGARDTSTFETAEGQPYALII